MKATNTPKLTCNRTLFRLFSGVRLQVVSAVVTPQLRF
jgi:hypothetical protein